MSFRTPVIWCHDSNLQSPEYESLIPNHNVDISSFSKLSKLFDTQPNQNGFLKSGQLTAMQELLTSHQSYIPERYSRLTVKWSKPCCHVSRLVTALSKEVCECIKCTKDQQKHFNFIDVLLSYYGHQHVSASHVAIFRAISLRTRIHL